MSLRLTSPALLIVSAAALLAACEGYSGKDGRAIESATESYNRAGTAQREDLVRRVQAAMRADPRLGGNILVESPSSGLIRLSGLPAGGTPVIGLALDTARRVPGVREVENRLAPSY